LKFLGSHRRVIIDKVTVNIEFSQAMTQICSQADRNLHQKEKFIQTHLSAKSTLKHPGPAAETTRG